MDESLWSEKTCSSLISALPLWIIEYAWSNRMADVLEVLGPPLWLEGDCGLLSLEEPCSIRVMAAEAWMVTRARDIKHFERVMEFLEVTHGLKPQLVSSIKHMKIMFGFKTLVIMWMLWDDQSETRITDKITRFFPDNLLQYHRSSRKHLKLMQKTQQDFRSFAQSLARNPDMRKAYIRDLMEEQYGERYAMKVEERLLHYLKELDKALPQPTHIDQILKQSLPLDKTKKLLHQLLTCNSASLPTAMKRLLRCAMATHSSQVDANKIKKRGEADRPVPDSFCVALRPSQESQDERVLKKCSQRTWLNRDKSTSLLRKGTENIYVERPPVQLKPRSGLRLEITQSDMDPCLMKHQDPQREDSGPSGGQKTIEEVTRVHLCSKHGKKMKSILLECSEELKGQNSIAPLAFSECTPPSPLAPLLQSTPQRQTHSSTSSSLQDSSSTYVSLSSHADSSSCFSTNHSEAEVREDPLQSSSSHQVTSSLSSPVKQQETAKTSSDQQQNISTMTSLSPKHILPLQLSSRQKISASSESSGTSLSQMKSLSLALASSSPLQECSLTLAKEHPQNQGMLKSAVTSPDISPLPKTSSSAQQDSSSSMFSKNLISSSASTSPAVPATASSSVQQERSLSMLFKNQMSSPESISPAASTTAPSSVQEESSLSMLSKNQINTHTSTSPATSNQSHNSVSFPGPARQDANRAISESDSVLRDKLKLSLETQGILLQCKGLQPQVLLCRLSQKNSAMTILPKRTRGQLCEEASSSVQQKCSSPLALSSVQQESPSSMLSQNRISSPTSTSPAPSPTALSSVQQESSSSMLSKNQISVLRDKLNRSLATQCILLQSKWLQPQVLIYRLSQKNSAMSSPPKRTRDQLCEEEEAEEEEDEEGNVSFDVNLLYSDSESDPQDSDDPDFVPSKKCKLFVDF